MKVSWLKLEQEIRDQYYKYRHEAQTAEETLIQISEIIGRRTGRGYELEPNPNC